MGVLFIFWEGEIVVKGQYRRRMDPDWMPDVRQRSSNPTMDKAIARVDGKDQPPLVRYMRSGLVSGLRPMKVERLIAAGGILTEAEQARVAYYQTGDVDEVARRFKKPASWIRQVCAWDIEQRRIQSAS